MHLLDIAYRSFHKHVDLTNEEEAAFASITEVIQVRKREKYLKSAVGKRFLKTKLGLDN